VAPRHYAAERMGYDWRAGDPRLPARQSYPILREAPEALRIQRGTEGSEQVWLALLGIAGPAVLLQGIADLLIASVRAHDYNKIAATERALVVVDLVGSNAHV
jgi:hypothetical protein